MSSSVAEQTSASPIALPHGRASSSSGLVHGVIVQFGGQTPLNLAKGLEEAGVPILGTSVDAIHRAGSREQFRDLIRTLGLKQPPNGIARNLDEARAIARDIGYPVLVRPSFVLGGRAMEIVYDEPALNRYMTAALAAAGLTGIADSPILIDKFLDNATEVDVDCVADYGTSGAGRAVIAGVLEHIEEAGIHSGDSACVLPPYSLSGEIVAELKRQTHELARALGVRGLMNVQFAVKRRDVETERRRDEVPEATTSETPAHSVSSSLRDSVSSPFDIYIIEVNPRASRTIPFVGKATGIPWANIAAKVMAGKSLDELGVYEPPAMDHVAVKEAVFPFAKFPGVDIILGPEMRSTGEVMGIDATFPMAYAKAQIAEGTDVPLEGTLFISVRDADKPLVIPIAREFARLGFKIISTSGTHAALVAAGIEATRIPKIADHARPNLADYIKNGDVQLILNTPTKKGAGTDEARIRALAFRNRIPIVTTITGGMAFARAIQALRDGDWDVRPLQSYHSAVPAGR
jgi:carbamoyl-phosphate synthase large subunit